MKEISQLLHSTLQAIKDRLRLRSFLVHISYTILFHFHFSNNNYMMYIIKIKALFIFHHPMTSFVTIIETY